MKKIINLFEQGNVIVTGLRGKGKDLLFANVVLRRGCEYVSNINYGGTYYPFDYSKIDLGGNTYRDFTEGTVKKYVFPYPDGTNFYLSDAGVYFPAQYCNELNKLYPQMPLFQAISRQVGTDSNFHVNVQNLNRVWDKLREQSDTYIRCEGVLYLKFSKLRKILPFFDFHDLVIQRVTIYDKYESCLNRMKKFSVRPPLFSTPQTRTMVDLQKQTYDCTHGMIKPRILIYRNLSTYNTYHFKEVLKNGK